MRKPDFLFISKTKAAIRSVVNSAADQCFVLLHTCNPGQFVHNQVGYPEDNFSHAVTHQLFKSHASLHI